jgi:HNH endonuclease
MPMPKNSIEKIEAKFIEKTDGCWLWKGHRLAGGYGQVSMNDKMKLAHRVVYEAFRGPIPEGLQLDHLCRNRGCVNPDHLEPVTQRVNTLRGLTLPAENSAKTHCKHGHPLSGDNLYVWNGSRGRIRACRTCKNDSLKRQRAKNGR